MKKLIWGGASHFRDCPGGTLENSPAFQCRGCGGRRPQVAERRLKCAGCSKSGLLAIRCLFGAMTLVTVGPFTANAQLPTNFPTLTVTTNYPSAVADGYVFQGVNLAATGVGYYAMI